MIEVPPDLDLEQAITHLLGFKKIAKYPKKLQAINSIEVPNTIKEVYKLADTLEEFAENLRNYGELYQEAETEDKSYVQDNADMYCQIEKLIWDKSGLTELHVPVQQKHKMWNHACKDTARYYQVHLNLCNLVELFML